MTSNLHRARQFPCGGSKAAPGGSKSGAHRGSEITALRILVGAHRGWQASTLTGTLGMETCTTHYSPPHSHRAGQTGAPKEPSPPVRPLARPVQSQFRPLSGLAAPLLTTFSLCKKTKRRRRKKNSLIPARSASSEAAPPRHNQDLNPKSPSRSAGRPNSFTAILHKREHTLPAYWDPMRCSIAPSPCR